MDSREPSNRALVDEPEVDPSDEASEIILPRPRRPRRTLEEKLESIVEPCLGLDIDRILTCKLRSGHSGPHIDPESGTRWGP
jgi:hypothetical protein